MCVCVCVCVCIAQVDSSIFCDDKGHCFLLALCISALAHNPRSPEAKSWRDGEIIDSMEF